jgi:hypothetical protein
MADLASNLPTNEEVTPTQIEMEVILPLVVQVFREGKSRTVQRQQQE